MPDTKNHRAQLDDTLLFFRLRLYIAGASSISSRAIYNLKHFLEEKLNENYDLEVVDIRQQPALAAAENITASPVLIKYEPIPKKLLIGDMSNEEQLKRGLGLI